MKPTSLRTAALTEVEHLYKIQTTNPDKPFYIQEKLNGVGFRARMLQDSAPPRPTVYKLAVETTRGKFWPDGFFGGYIACGLLHILMEKPADSTLYGEFVAADQPTPLATLAGAISVNRAERDPTVPINAMVYDIDPCIAQDFSHRYKRLTPYRFHTKFYHDYRRHVQIVEVYKHTAVVTIEQAYADVIADGGEGLIIRQDPCFFCDGRSPQMWKWKRIREMEGRCINIEEGTGKRKGMLGALILQLDNGSVLKVGGGAGMTDELLKELWCHPPIKMPVTFSYEELSINGMPLRPQFIAVRYE